RASTNANFPARKSTPTEAEEVSPTFEGRRRPKRRPRRRPFGLDPNKAEEVSPSFGGRRGLFGTRFVKIGVLENALLLVSTPNRRFARLDEREFSGAEVDADRSGGSFADLWRATPTEAEKASTSFRA
ncbi:MAG: hypothetical protein IJN32_06630, partial [Thermoguttaceae bacterium]|nr:hypothetical protein [Thermoguttaceae bacterium]